MNLASWGNISIFKSTISRGKQSNVLLYREKCKWLFGSNHPEDKNNRKDFERKYRSHSRRHYFHWPWKICKNFSYFINQLIKHFISPAVTERKNPPPKKKPNEIQIYDLYFEVFQSIKFSVNEWLESRASSSAQK